MNEVEVCDLVANEYELEYAYLSEIKFITTADGTEV